MTNEELSVEIKAGRAGYGELWEQVQAFVRQQAARYTHQNAGLCAGAGVEFEDLLQAGFLALHDAVKGFEPEAGMSFVGYLAFHLKRYFRSCCGIRTSKRDPLDRAARLDAPVSDEDGAATLGELTPDTQAEAEREAIEDEVFQEQLRGAMTKALNTLDGRQQDIIRRRYWNRETLSAVAGHTEITLERVRQIEGKAMRSLRRGPCIRLLQPFIEEMRSGYAWKGTSLTAYRESGASSVERAAEKTNELMKRIRQQW